VSQRILLVEDDAPLRAAVAATLAEAASGEEALARLQIEGADLVLLDLMLPGLDGMQVLERIRRSSDVPVIVLTVRSSKADKLAALDAGADDYVTKPFDSDELQARARAALRRRVPQRAAPLTLTFGDLVIDRPRRIITRGGEPVNLTPTEWHVLDLLLEHEGSLVTYATLAAEVPTRSGALDRQATRVFVAQLRRKLGDDASDPRLVLTHFGLGIRWIATPDPATG
jgi:two-component system KDP operon response regulator KdpE